MSKSSDLERKVQQADADMQDGFHPETRDASDPTQATLDHVQAGPERKIKIGEVIRGGRDNPAL